MSTYPDWFKGFNGTWDKPVKPVAPTKFKREYLYDDEYTLRELVELYGEDATIEYDRYDPDELWAITIPVDNEVAQAKYQEALVKYGEDLAIWTERNKEYPALLARANMEKELKELKRLQTKYEGLVDG